VGRKPTRVGYDQCRRSSFNLNTHTHVSVISQPISQLPVYECVSQCNEISTDILTSSLYYLLFFFIFLLIIFMIHRRFVVIITAARLKGQIRGPTSVSRCPSRGHISKTKQDRPIVTIKHCTLYIIADSVVAFRSSSNAPLGRHSGFKYKTCVNSGTASCSTSLQTTAVAGVFICYNRSATLETCCLQSLFVALTMPKSNRRRDRLLFAVRDSCFISFDHIILMFHFVKATI